VANTQKSRASALVSAGPRSPCCPIWRTRRFWAYHRRPTGRSWFEASRWSGSDTGAGYGLHPDAERRSAAVRFPRTGQPRPCRDRRHGPYRTALRTRRSDWP